MDIEELPDMPKLEMHLPFNKNPIPGFSQQPKDPNAPPEKKIPYESLRTINLIQEESPYMDQKYFRN